jgi:hypothetical protein
MVAVMPLNAQAASQKTKALAAYTKLLQKTSITIKGDTYKLSDASFAVVYIDNNSVPELFLKLKRKMGNDYLSRIALYTYKNGKAKLAYTESIGLLGDYGNSYSYYKKTGVFRFSFSHGDYRDDSYYKLSGTSVTEKLRKELEYLGNKTNTTYADGKGKTISKSSYTSQLKKLTKSKKRTSIVLNANTAVNRASYLK